MKRSACARKLDGSVSGSSSIVAAYGVVVDHTRRGVVYIAPTARYLPRGRMVEPARSPFSVHSEDWDGDAGRGELLELGGAIVGAEAAIEWGRARCDRVLIRLTHSHDGQYSAGAEPLTDERAGHGDPLPTWPPKETGREPWWTPEDEAAAALRARERGR